MALTEIKPIVQIARTGDNLAGRGCTDGTHIYIPIVTGGIASLCKYDVAGTSIWERSLYNTSSTATSAIAPDGTILVASSSGGSPNYTSALARFNEAGEKIWEIADLRPTLTNVAVHGGTVYVSGGNGTGFNSANTAFVSAYSLDNGTILWSREYPNSGASFINDLEIADSSIYVAASPYGKIDFDTAIAGRLDLNGNEIWWKSAPANDWNAVWSVRVVGDQLLGVGYKADGFDRGDNRLISFNKETGSILWDKSWGDNNQQGSANIEILGGRIYVSYGDGLAWNSTAISGGFSVVDELDESGNLLKAYKFDVQGANDTAGSLVTISNSLYMIGSTKGAIQGQVSGGGTDVYIASVIVASKPIVRGSSLYTIVDGPSWTEAEADSQKLGGHLTSVLSSADNDWLLTSFIPNLQSSYWIGASDQAQEGNWQWSDGLPWSYSNWEVGQPDNASNEDYAQFVPGWNGKWNDLPLTYTVPGIQKTDKGIAKIPFIRRGNSAYVIVQGPTWEEAEANAVKLGGHLVAINDKEENDWLSTITYRNPDKIQASYWIGLTDRDIEGTWKWLSGDAYGFSQWNVGHPNSFDAGPEDYVVIGSNSTSPTWINISNSNTFYRNWGWDSLGIAEIKLAPNNTPIGIPTISGSTRVGSTLAIDTTPIRDSDNFTGYDVRYSYKWEVSTDGNLWSRLTTPDATDNNASYALTAAESGKSIRGIVTYIDGYGTHESVATPFYGGISNEQVIGKESLVNNGDALIDSAYPTNLIRLLTVPHGKGSAWWNSAVDLRLDWSTSFYVTAFNGSGTSDGFTFSINGDPRGTAAIGGGGQNLGFFGANGEYGVSGSYAVLFDMWTTQPASQLGFSKSTDSFIPEAPFGLPISLANNAYNVVISYSSSRGTLDVSVGGQTFSQSVNLASVIGSSGYLGFTAANGGGTMDTDIRNWSVNATQFLPSVNLASSQSSATEDRSDKLIYTFTRNGPSINPLTVYYTVSGSATIGSDYTGIPSASPTKTVTFAAGSLTATVTVDPVTDTVRESNETVTLTVVSGSGYTLGSTSTATGVIIDDDRDFRLSTVSGLSLLQDDSTGLIRLKRANSSSVPVTWGNNTPLTAATFPGWQLLAAAQLDGADSLLWRYLPTGQLHTWTLDQNGRQTSGSSLFAASGQDCIRLERQFLRDLNSDAQVGPRSSIISRFGSTTLFRSASTDRLLVQAVDPIAASSALITPLQLWWGGSPLLAADSRLPGWSAVAASNIDGVNTLLWRNQGAGLLATWAFDDLWNAVSGTAPVLANSASAFALEKAFKSDLNSDGVVGAPFVVLAADGATSLVRLTSNRRLAVQSSNGLVQPLLWGGSAITEADPRLPGWSAVSAGVVNGVNTVVWRNSSASLLATWSFDSQWRATGGTSPVPFSSPQVWDYETWSKKDLNNDHVIGVPPSGVVSTVGDLWLQRLGPNLNLYAFKPGSPTFSLRWGGSQLSTTDPRLSGWSPVAAATINGVNSLLWRYDATGQLTTWAFDGSWNAINGTPPVQAVSQAAYDLETAFRSDANRDGVIGSPHQVISSIGSIDLLASDDGLLLIGRDGLPPISMAWGGGALTVNDPRLTGWTAIAAADINGSNSLLWRHTTGQLATWTFDANWNALSGTAPVLSDSQAALAIEADFIRDLNGDGAIGEPTSPIERLRYRLQQVAPSSNSREPFSAVFSGGSSADVIVNPLTGNGQSNVLMSGSDFITGLPLQAGAIDLLDGGTGPGRNTFLLSTITNQPFADDGDSGYVLIRNYDTLNDDLVVASDLPLSTSVRSVAFDGITVTGIGLHVDKNQNGLYDSGDNLIGLLDGITTVPSRLIRLPAG